MKFTFGILNNLVNKMQKEILFNRVSNITMINSKDFLVSFNNYRKEKLFVSLNHQTPFISFVKVEGSFKTTMCQTNEILRKQIKDSLITSIGILNDDRVVEMTITKNNDYFIKENKRIVIELLPTKPNLLILDDKNLILFATRYASLNSVRPILKGIPYNQISKNHSFIPNFDVIDIDVFQKEAEKKLYEGINTQRKEAFSSLFAFIKNKIKSLQNKLIVFKIENDKANKDLVFLDHGNSLLSLSDNHDEAIQYLITNNLQYDERFSLGQIANSFFKIYKKAKRTIEMNNILEKETYENIDKLNHISALVNYMDNDELTTLEKELIPHKYKTKSKENKSNISFVTYDSIKIFFGKNAQQNELITFKKAKPDYIFFHIKDYHGSHVVIEQDNPNNEVMLVASEMCLILSNKENGDVQFTRIKNVKKGKKIGQVTLSSYQTITLHTVRESTKQLLSHYQH